MRAGHHHRPETLLAGMDAALAELVILAPKHQLYFASFLYNPHRVISLWAMLSDSAKSR